jgi:two-component system chemotaxis response regulator CheY
MAVTVLVVDDSATMRQQVGAALTTAGFAVAEASDGVEGKARLLAGGVGCVICDVNMPHKNGIEMVEELMAESLEKLPPIIMLTTEGSPQSIRRAKAAGASGWMVKPFRAELLVAAVRKLTS